MLVLEAQSFRCKVSQVHPGATGWTMWWRQLAIPWMAATVFARRAPTLARLLRNDVQRCLKSFCRFLLNKMIALQSAKHGQGCELFFRFTCWHVHFGMLQSFHLRKSLTFSNHLELGASIWQVEQGFECANFESSPSSCWPRCGKCLRLGLNSTVTILLMIQWCKDKVIQLTAMWSPVCPMHPHATSAPNQGRLGKIAHLETQNCVATWALSTCAWQAMLWRHWIRLAGQARSHDIVTSLVALCLDIGSRKSPDVETSLKVPVPWSPGPLPSSFFDLRN